MTPNMFRQLSAKIGLLRSVRDPDGNVTAFMEPSGSLIGMGGIQVPRQSGDTSGVTDRTNINAAFVKAAARYGRVVFRKGLYILDYAVRMLDNLHVEFEPGTILMLRGKTVATATLVNASNVLTNIDTTGIVIGMHVSDSAASLNTGDAFGAIPYGALVTAVDPIAHTVTLSTPVTAAKTANLNFHPRSNVIEVIGVSNWSMRCPGGWAYLDGNGSNSYPYNANSDDANRNALRIAGLVTGGVIDGVECRNAFYHGTIAVQQLSGIRFMRYRAVNNGYRAVHFHGEALGGNATPEVRDNFFGRIEIEGNGYNAFRARAGDENNSGMFIVFSNCLNWRVESLLAKNEYGYAFATSGGSGAFYPSYVAKHGQVGSMIMENCGMGVTVSSNVEDVQFGPLIGWGRKDAIPSCTFFATASELRYYVTATGVVNSIKTRLVDIPIAGIATYGIRPGMRIFASGGTTGMPSRGVVVWEVSVGTGAGGKDQLRVFNDLNEAGDPYTTAGSATVYLRGCKGTAIEFYAAAGQKVSRIKFGSVTLTDSGQYGISCQFSDAEHRYFDISFESYSVNGAFVSAGDISSMKDFSFGSWHEKNCASGFDNGGVTGSYDAFLQNCANGEIRNFRRTKDATFSNDNEAMRFNANCRSIDVYPTSVSPSATAPAFRSLVPSGAAVNAAGIAGPVVLHDPRALNGTPLTVAGGQIIRTDATACIVTRPVDAT